MATGIAGLLGARGWLPLSRLELRLLWIVLFVQLAVVIVVLYAKKWDLPSEKDKIATASSQVLALLFNLAAYLQAALRGELSRSPRSDLRKLSVRVIDGELANLLSYDDIEQLSNEQRREILDMYESLKPLVVAWKENRPRLSADPADPTARAAFRSLLAPYRRDLIASANLVRSAFSIEASGLADLVNMLTVEAEKSFENAGPGPRTITE